MKYNKILALIPAMLLAACGGDEQTVNQKTSPGSVVYSYPADGQKGVSPKADIVLKFSDPITDDDIAGKISVTNSKGPVDYSLELIDGGQSLKLTPSAPFAVNSSYSVEFNDGLLAEGGRVIENPNSKHDNVPGIQFDTRSSFSGSKGLANFKESFEVTNMVPKVGGEFKPMNFSTFRLTVSHPIHPDWQAMGGKIELFDKDNNAVPATVLVKGNRITLDPCVTDDRMLCGGKQDVLNAGETYTLAITDLPSLTTKDAVFSQSYEFTPRDTGPTVVLQQTAIDSGIGNGMSEGAATASILNGQPINGVKLNSVLLGTTDTSQQTGDLFAELAYAPGFEANEALPLRIAKGSVLNSTSLDVKVGGTVNVLDAATGLPQTTGNIKVTMLSDASGYMSPNPYTDDMNAPRQITLFMDVSMNAENPQPNASLSQDLLGVELRGIALVRDGVLTIDAIGMVEPNLLGQEFVDSTIAFHLEAATDADSALDAEQGLEDLDKTGPTLVSWMPGDEDAIPNTRQSMQRPGDPIILFFDKPLDPDSVADGVSLSGPNATSDGETTVGSGLNAEVDGTSLTLNPDGGLVPGGDYIVSVPGLRGINGKPVDILTVRFKMDGITTPSSAPPLALTTYPGFPCEADFTNMNLLKNELGECYSVRTPGHNKGNSTIEVDLLPVDSMPADRPITVVFSQSMDPQSFILGKEGTFIVEKITATDDGKPNEAKIGAGEIVSGRIELNNQQLRFFPDKPWEPGEFYRYTMKSVQDDDPETCHHEMPTSLCGTNKLALKTDILEGINDGDGTNGADDLIIYFEGTEKLETVFTALRNLPVRDTNSNFLIDCADNYDVNCVEPFEVAHENLGNDIEGWGPSANSTKLAVTGGKAKASLLKTGTTEGLTLPDPDARVGCAAGTDGTSVLINPGDPHPDCPRNKFIYQTYALNTEVLGPGIYDPTPEIPNSGDEIEGIRVSLYPTLLTTTSISVFTQLKLGAKIFGQDTGLLLQEESITNTQILRMRYSKDDPSCETNCSRNSLIPGVIAKGDKGQPVFVTQAELLIDAPDMVIPMSGTHDLYGRAFTLELEGDVTFFDDGRMQIEQINTNRVGANDELLVVADALGIKNAGLATIELPLEIPVGGTYLNFITNPVKDLPAVQ